MIIQYNFANCVTTISQINPERRCACSHTMQYNIILGTVMGWVRVWTLIKNYFLRDCKIVINIFDIFLCRNWILESRLDHWTTTEHKIREKTTALGLRRQQNVSLWDSHQPSSFSTDFWRCNAKNLVFMMDLNASILGDGKLKGGVCRIGRCIQNTTDTSTRLHMWSLDSLMWERCKIWQSK